MKKLLVIILACLMLLNLTLNPPALAADTANGAKIFEINCTGCHPQGSNIIRRGKNLKKRALAQNKINSLEAISNLVANGKNNMSAFKDRLNEQEIATVSVYVLEQAEKNWE